MKKHVVVVSFVMFMSTISTLKADYAPIDICVDVAGNQINPDISGDIVVWEDGVDIYWLDLSDPNMIQHKIDQAGVQKNAAVSGSKIVWQDERVAGNRDIYVYDIVAQAAQPLAYGAHQRYPDISGEMVVCDHYTGSIYNAAVWDPQTSHYDLISPTSTTQTTVAIDGLMVVWRDDRDSKNQIYRCDLSIIPYQPVPVYPAGISQWRPAVSGDMIVWEDMAVAGSVTLRAYDVSRGDVVWTHTLTGTFEAQMTVSDGIIVWHEPRAGASDYNIRGYDLNTGAFLDIATGVQDDRYPAISGRAVVWQRNGTDIVGAIIPSPKVITVLSPVGGEQVLTGSEMTIAWEMTEGAAPEMVTIEFSANSGGNWQILAADIPFSDPGYLWSPVADVDSQACLIRVSAADDASVSDVSEPFTIFQCSPNLTADLTGDCFVGMDDFAELAAQWLACGNPYNAGWCVGQ